MNPDAWAEMQPVESTPSGGELPLAMCPVGANGSDGGACRGVTPAAVPGHSVAPSACGAAGFAEKLWPVIASKK